MVKIYDFLWKRLTDYGKKFQSGMDIVDDFNGKIAEIQLEIINDLSPFYQANELVRGIIGPWVRKAVGTSLATGIIPRPTVDKEDFMRVLSMGVIDENDKYLFPMNQYTENELAISSRVPQRKPNIAKKIAGYTPYKASIQLYPEQSIHYLMYYLIYPTEAKIAFTYQSTSDEDVMTIDRVNTIDLLWDQNAANLLLYKLLEKYGITSREQLLAEYGKLGVNISMGGNINGN